VRSASSRHRHKKETADPSPIDRPAVKLPRITDFSLHAFHELQRIATCLKLNAQVGDVILRDVASLRESRGGARRAGCVQLVHLAAPSRQSSRRWHRIRIPAGRSVVLANNIADLFDLVLAHKRTRVVIVDQGTPTIGAVQEDERRACAEEYFAALVAAGTVEFDASYHGDSPVSAECFKGRAYVL